MVVSKFGSFSLRFQSKKCHFYAASTILTSAKNICKIFAQLGALSAPLQTRSSHVTKYRSPAQNPTQDYMRKVRKHSKPKLLPHEKALLEQGKLRNVSHSQSSSIWLEAKSKSAGKGRTLVYRPMGDAELSYLRENNQLPDTQPYQAIIRGEPGRIYSEKYLKGHKKVNTNPTTVVEFDAPTALIDDLFKRFHKPEDGVLSCGLGPKAGGDLELFNEALSCDENKSSQQYVTWKIVTVKRRAKKKK